MEFKHTSVLLDETIDAMFISETYKTVLDEEIDGFLNKTKIIDTAGIDEEGVLGNKKREKTKEAIAESGVSEPTFFRQCKKLGIKKIRKV